MFEFYIAKRYLLTKKKEHFLSIINLFSLIGITLGVATLIIVMSVMNGYEKELVTKILGMQGHLEVFDQNISNTVNKGSELSKKVQEISKIQEVQLAMPVIKGEAMVTANNVVSGVMVEGVNISDLQRKSIMTNALTSTSWKDLENNSQLDDGVIIGSALSQKLEITIGSNIKIISPNFNQTLFGAIPRSKTFKVIGVFDVGMHEYNASIVFMPIKTAAMFFQKEAPDFIEITLHSINDLNKVKAEIRESLNDNWGIIDWRSVNQTMVQVLTVERHVMFLILSLIIMIAAFNIISSLIILVNDKKKSIAVLRTIGASRESIMKIFILCGFSIGFIGTILGVILGVAFSLSIDNIKRFLEITFSVTLFDPVIYYLTSLPSDISVTQVILIALMSLTVSLLVTIYPALKIASISPAELIRDE